jgi:protein ImuA
MQMPHTDVAELHISDRRALLEGLRRRVRALESPAPRWGGVRLGEAQAPTLARGAIHEAQPSAYLDGPAAAGFALAITARAMAQAPGGALILVAPGGGDFGAPYAPGLKRWGLDPARLLFARAKTTQEALAALEEAARTPGLSAVTGFLPARIDEAAARRLQRASEAAGAFVALWRPFGASGVSGARSRWRVAAHASAAPPWAQAAGLSGRAVPPGAPRLRVAAQKGRAMGEEQIWEWRNATHGFCLSAAVASGTLHLPAGRRSA